jgi:hypothetical protein
VDDDKKERWWWKRDGKQLQIEIQMEKTLKVLKLHSGRFKPSEHKIHRKLQRQQKTKTDHLFKYREIPHTSVKNATNALSSKKNKDSKKLLKTLQGLVSLEEYESLDEIEKVGKRVFGMLLPVSEQWKLILHKSHND